MGKNYRAQSKTYRKPKRPFEKERLDAEMKVVGEYGLKNKREVLRVQYALAKIRTAARHLLTLDEKDEKRLFQGDALLRRMVRIGLLLDSERKLDYVLGLSAAKMMERRLQTKVFKQGLATSIHHARVLIRQRHIRVGRQIVNVPSFVVRVESQKHIDHSLKSPFGGGRPGRVKRKSQANKASKADAGDDEGKRCADGDDLRDGGDAERHRRRAAPGCGSGGAATPAHGRRCRRPWPAGRRTCPQTC